ncbi:hypothetical protein KSS87_020400, partial [Heliosperma pusillum]
MNYCLILHNNWNRNRAHGFATLSQGKVLGNERNGERETEG